MNLIVYIIIAFSMSIVLEFCMIRLCQHFEWYDQLNARKVHTGNIPRLGSVGIIIPFVVVAVLYLINVDSSHIVGYLPLIIPGVIIFLFGIIDDFCTLPAKTKLVIQILAALILVFGEYRFRYIGPFQLPEVFSYIITFCWILGMVNSFNLIDGIDALCGGISFIISIFFALLLYKEDYSLTALSLLLAASLIGFLVFNKPKAKIFMGDGGSQTLGFLLAAIPLHRTDISFECNKLPIMAILAAIPLIDTIAAIWRRKREHRSFFTPDKAHLHHKLMYMGFSVYGILLILGTLQILLGCAVLLSASLTIQNGFLLLLITFGFVLIFFSIIHYTNRALHLANRELQNDQSNQ